MKLSAKYPILFMTAICSISVQAAPLNRMVANWHMDEGKGQRVIDLSGNNKNGILGASPTADAADPAWVLRRFDNNALKFDGSKFVKVAHDNILEPAKITVEAWVKPSPAVDATVLPYIVAKSGDQCQFAAYGLYLHNDAAGNLGVPYFYISDGTSYSETPDGAPSLLDGNWHHVAGTYDQVNVSLYVDGVLVGSSPASPAINYGHFANKGLYIGDYDGDSAICNDYNGAFVGLIDEVRIWSKPLTATEISKRYLGY